MNASKVHILKQRLLDKLLGLLDDPAFDERRDATAILTVSLSVVKTFHDETQGGVALISDSVSKNLAKFQETRGSA